MNFEKFEKFNDPIHTVIEIIPTIVSSNFLHGKTVHDTVKITLNNNMTVSSVVVTLLDKKNSKAVNVPN